MAEKAQHSAPTSGLRMEVRHTQAPTAPMAQMTADFTGAPKRTVDGEIKDRSPTSPTVGKYGHSRTSSMTSRGSQIGEVG